MGSGCDGDGVGTEEPRRGVDGRGEGFKSSSAAAAMEDALLACRMQLSHCCLLKVSLAWKQWACSWPPQRYDTRKKFLAEK